jgi:nicotinamide mononucleotide transporter PnuC
LRVHQYSNLCFSFLERQLADGISAQCVLHGHGHLWLATMEVWRSQKKRCADLHAWSPTEHFNHWRYPGHHSRIGSLLSQHSDAAWPYVDSFTTWASVITTVMVAKKILENWLYWLVIDSISIPLYVDRGLYPTAMLFVAYLIIVIFGYIKWRRHYLEQQSLAATV